MGMDNQLLQLLDFMHQNAATDLHLTVGAPPAFRIQGEILTTEFPRLTTERSREMCFSLLEPMQVKKFEREKELDFSFGFQGKFRCRVNLFMQRGSVAGVFRRIPEQVMRLADLKFPSKVTRMVEKPHGLILVTGATGSGKSTTIASFLDHLNRTRNAHIITIEDPIEYAHHHQRSLVNQREVGSDCFSFATALRQVLREDPDIIMVGEMRDAETAEAALRAAETGHLVFSTLHTNGAVNSLTRLIQMFPITSHDYVRNMLSFSLEGVISQVLLRRATNRGLLMVYEFLAMTPAVRNLIRENKFHQLYGQMQIGQENSGMSTLNQNLLRLAQEGVITVDEAWSNSPDPEEFGKLVSATKGLKRGAA
jgi:twitching motility protein PilT